MTGEQTENVLIDFCGVGGGSYVIACAVFSPLLRYAIDDLSSHISDDRAVSVNKLAILQNANAV